MDSLIPTANPLIIWGLFTRGLGVIYLISFISLSGQVLNGAGSEGALSISLMLSRIRKDFPTWRRFYYFPTLLWINSSDAMLRGLTFVGMAGAVAVIYGGPFSFWGLVVCYLCYLSLDPAMSLIFPWDCLLFECTVLGLFLPATHVLPDVRAVTAPAPLLAWAYRLLVFRLMFGFGKQKFLGSRPKDMAYLKGFLVNQPLPSPAGWYSQKLPVTLLKGLVFFMFLAEIPVPFLAFFPGWLSIVCALVTMALMVGIQTMGSFGYFSFATIILCIPLFDNVTPMTLHLSELFAPGQPVLVNVFVIIHTLGAICAFPFNSWLGQSWHLWAFWYRLPKWVQPIFGFFRTLHPFRWLHPFGVFPPNNQPGVKITVLVEATWDRKEWHELSFHFSPSNPKSRPKFVSPHHPRGDQAIIYDTFGLNPTSLIASVLGAYSPYPFGNHSPAPSYCQSVLRGRTLDFVQGEVLEQHSEPPVQVRMSTVMLEPVTIKEHRETGNWWRRSYIGPHVPPQELDTEFWDYAIAEPEMWHFDSIFWRRRSRLKPLMDRAAKGDEDPMQLALVDAGNITAEDVARFWDELIPMIASPVRDSFETLPDVTADMKSRFDRRRVRAFYRLLNRFALFLVVKLEPMYLHRGFKPEIPVKTYFHLWMLAHHIIGCGKDAYLAALADPKSVMSYLPEMTNQTGLYPLSIFRLGELTFEAQKLRLIDDFVYPHDQAEKKANADKLREGHLEGLPRFERTLIRIAMAVSGFLNVLLDIRESFEGPRFDHGYPELYPKFKELDSGTVVIDEYVKPPPGVTVPLSDETAPDRSAAAE